MQQKKFRFTTEEIVRIGMMGAVAALLGFYPEIPMAFFAPWLKLDFSYLPMLLTGFALGAVPGLMVLIIKNIFQLLTTESVGIGQLADMLVGCAMLFPAVSVYYKMRTRKGALIGMATGLACMCAVGLLSNRFILLPFYLGDGFNAYMDNNPAVLWTAVLPFNLIKGGMISLLTYLLYKPLSRFLKRGLKG